MQFPWLPAASVAEHVTGVLPNVNADPLEGVQVAGSGVKLFSTTVGAGQLAGAVPVRGMLVYATILAGQLRRGASRSAVQIILY